MGHPIWNTALAAVWSLAAVSCTERTARETVGSGSSSGPEEAGSASVMAGTSSNAASAAASPDAASAAANPPIVLADAEGSPVALVVDSANVYWLDLGPFVGPGGKVGGSYPNGELRRCAIGGCGNQPTTLASGWGAPQPMVPGALTLGNGTLYWSGGGSVLSCPVTGCSGGFATLVSGVGATGVAVDAQRVYWTIYDTGEIASAPVDGSSPPVTMATGQVGPSSSVADATELYWATYAGTVVGCAPTGCPSGPTVLWSGVDTQSLTIGLAQDALRLYWTNGNPIGAGSVFACDKADCRGTSVAIENAASSPLGIAVDDANVYWTELGDTYANGQAVPDAGSVRKAPKHGGTVTTIADHQSFPSAIAVDGHAIYWATQGATAGQGQIVQLAK
jgi:hypothetical protein